MKRTSHLRRNFLKELDEIKEKISRNLLLNYEELSKNINKLDEKNISLKKKVFKLQKELDEIKEKFSKFEASKILLRM